MVTRVQSIQKGVNDDAKATNMMKQVTAQRVSLIEIFYTNVLGNRALLGEYRTCEEARGGN